MKKLITVLTIFISLIINAVIIFTINSILSSQLFHKQLIGAFRSHFFGYNL